MKYKQIITFMAIMYSSVSLNAQSGILQTITSDAKNAATKKVMETADKTVNKTLDKILDGNIFKKRSSKADNTSTTEPTVATTVAASGATELSISNIDYSSIVALAGTIRSNKNVSDVQRSFSNGLGIISVVHSCKTDELLDEILKDTGDKYEVAQLEKGKITLRLKK